MANSIGPVGPLESSSSSSAAKASDAIASIIAELSEDKSVDNGAMGALRIVNDMMQSNLRSAIDEILLPIIFMLRTRIRKRDVKYFSNPAMISGIKKAVEELCGKQWDIEAARVGAGKMRVSRDRRITNVNDYVLPIVDAIHIKARQYESSKNYDFETTLSQLNIAVQHLSELYET